MRKYHVNPMLVGNYFIIDRVEVGWFDDQRREVGSLTSQLATDAATVKAVSWGHHGHRTITQITDLWLPNISE